MTTFMKREKEVTVGVDLPESLVERLRLYSEASGKKIKRVVAEALEEYLDSREDKCEPSS